MAMLQCKYPATASEAWAVFVKAVAGGSGRAASLVTACPKPPRNRDSKKMRKTMH